MEYKDIKYKVEDKLAIITLNNPSSLNAFTGRMIDEWADAIQKSQDDKNIRVLMITGAGRGFCSGLNVKETAANTAQLPLYQRRDYLKSFVHKIPRALEQLDKPYIAAVNGPAAGAGMDMANMADIRVIAASARVGMNYVRMGLLPGDAGCYFLPRIIGVSRAFELIWTGRMIDAQEALNIGWASQVFPDKSFLEMSKEYCRQFMNAPVATQYAKRLVWRGIDQFRNINMEMAEMAMVINFSSPDSQEGPRAWVEQREPQWSGE